MGKKWGREGDGLNTEFPTRRVASHDGGGGGGKESVAEKLVAEARAEDLDVWV